MKKEVIIWQIITLIIGLLFIFTIRNYFENKNKIEAKNYAVNCLINIIEKNIELHGACSDIKSY